LCKIDPIPREHLFGKLRIIQPHASGAESADYFVIAEMVSDIDGHAVTYHYAGGLALSGSRDTE